MKKRPQIRNPVAYALALRGKGKVMKDRRTPRGGRRNEMAEALAEVDDELYDEEDDGLLAHVFEEEPDGTDTDPGK